jgi:hypothetical protein
VGWTCPHRRPRPGQPSPPGRPRRPQAPRAVRKAAARDFADVYVLARRFGKDTLLARAAQIDAGFDATVLAGMIATLDRFTDSDIPVPDGTSVAELRAFYAAWRAELSA